MEHDHTHPTDTEIIYDWHSCGEQSTLRDGTFSINVTYANLIDLITIVREDERKRSDLYMQGYADGRSDAKELSEINAKVYYNYGYDDGYTAAKCDAVEAVTNAGIGNDSKYQKEIDIFAIQSLGEER